MSYYYENRKRAQTVNTDPTMTDQAGAHDTDINVIVKTFRRTGMVPGAQQPPMVGMDFTQLPTDLRGFIETANTLNQLRNKLPEQFRGMDLAELMALTPADIQTKLQPPAPTPAPKENAE